MERYSLSRAAILLVVTAFLGCEASTTQVEMAKTESATAPQSENGFENNDAVQITQTQELLPAGERFTTEEFSVLIPKGWSNSQQLTSGIKKLFIVGDGKGVSVFDDNRAPLQLGMSVEHYPDKELIEDRIRILTEDARTAPQRTLASEPAVEQVELADGTKASLMIVEMIKQETRRSLYMKLLVQDQSGTTWATSAWIVASKDSKLPITDSDLANRMQSFIQSFTLAENVEP